MSMFRDFLAIFWHKVFKRKIVTAQTNPFLECLHEGGVVAEPWTYGQIYSGAWLIPGPRKGLIVELLVPWVPSPCRTSSRGTCRCDKMDK